LKTAFVDVCVCVECLGVFGLITKKPDDKEEKLFVFAVDDASASKTEFLTSLSKTVCSSQCRADYVSVFRYWPAWGRTNSGRWRLFLMFR